MLVRLGGFTGYFDFSEYLKRRQKGKRGEESRKALKKVLVRLVLHTLAKHQRAMSHPPHNKGKLHRHQPVGLRGRSPTVVAEAWIVVVLNELSESLRTVV